MKRGAITKESAKLVNFYAPDELLVIVDEAVVQLDSDRSKFIRGAIREKLERHKKRVPKGVGT
ncbi:MAG TPA: ribbon-helix-helix domain-containing protein [Verrucomicrobiae bacterium]|nr:ribbon-helix-helix domain-containing protein [Verrucomicrobiae bacterium]